MFAAVRRVANEDKGFDDWGQPLGCFRVFPGQAGGECQRAFGRRAVYSGSPQRVLPEPYFRRGAALLVEQQSRQQYQAQRAQASQQPGQGLPAAR